MIIIVDFGSQYTQLIAQRIREEKVYCEILPYYEITPEKIKNFSLATDTYSVSASKSKGAEVEGIIFSGGPSSVYEEGAPSVEKGIFDLNIPILGICYGLQLIAKLFNGKVERAPFREYGYTEFTVIKKKNILFTGVPEKFTVWMSHGDSIVQLPKNFITLGSTTNCKYASIAYEAKKIYAVQFHPEVKHTLYGDVIFKNFLFKICHCKPTWTMKSFIEAKTKEIKDTVKDGNAICALSGGVDSSVAATLAHRALGKKLYCIFVDNGILRKGEKERVKKIFTPLLGKHLVIVNAQDKFLTALRNVSDPERKRKIIGHTFIRVFEEVSKRLPNVNYLIQGTLYPDVIESIPVRGPSATIKTHHNVGGLPKRIKFKKIIEPLRFLFKNEVRALGRELGLPEEILLRHPFPGPGLAVRILGPIDKKKLDIVRECDAIVEEEVREAGLYEKVWQAFAVLLPVKSVGVMGDKRTYENVVAVRIVESVDAMTANWANIPYDVLNRISTRIVNEVRNVNRVVYDITSKPPATIEWE